MFAGPAAYKAVTRLEAVTHRKSITRQFEEDMRQEFLTIQKALPSKLNAILDIGCGIAGVDLLLYTDTASKPDIYLLDKTDETKDIYFGFKEEASYYNSLSLARTFLEINGVPSNKIHTQEVTSNKSIDFPTQFNLIISLLSWGFHYPIETYLDKSYSLLASGGVLILDIRKGQGSEEAIKHLFGNLEILFETPKMAKVKAVRQ